MAAMAGTSAARATRTRQGPTMSFFPARLSFRGPAIGGFEGREIRHQHRGPPNLQQAKQRGGARGIGSNQRCVAGPAFNQLRIARRTITDRQRGLELGPLHEGRHRGGGGRKHDIHGSSAKPVHGGVHVAAERVIQGGHGRALRGVTRRPGGAHQRRHDVDGDATVRLHDAERGGKPDAEAGEARGPIRHDQTREIRIPRADAAQYRGDGGHELRRMPPAAEMLDRGGMSRTLCGDAARVDRGVDGECHVHVTYSSRRRAGSATWLMRRCAVGGGAWAPARSGHSMISRRLCRASASRSRSIASAGCLRR